jgi:membrane-bound lytic murein transglycosylase B
MKIGKWWCPAAASVVLVSGLGLAETASAAQCGNTAADFDKWKQDFAEEAKAEGYGASTLSALRAAPYATATIRADRGQKSFRLSLDAFLAKRGGSIIVSRGRALKQTHAALLASLEQRYGVPPGPLLAIWGMETGFGRISGNQNTLSAVATLAYDCRRSAFFTEHLHAALTLMDRGVITPQTRGSMHGELGQTQFMPKAILQNATGGSLETPTGALSATANFLKGHGWQAGGGYQPGEVNFTAIQRWNAASVYQRAIAVIAQQIDGGGRPAFAQP